MGCYSFVQYLLVSDGTLNAKIKAACRKLHRSLVTSVNPVSIIDRLFSDGVLDNDNCRGLYSRGGDSVNQFRELLTILHMSHHREAFISFLAALREDPTRKWLVEEIEKVNFQPFMSMVYKAIVNE
jgi:hypothetical protein